MYMLCSLLDNAADIMFGGGVPVVCSGDEGCAADLPAGQLCRHCYFDKLGAGVEGGSAAQGGQEPAWDGNCVILIKTGCRLCVSVSSSVPLPAWVCMHFRPIMPTI